ncbi:MAG TPA: hypothetical protein VGS22_13600 [Thermoanaerobaculia bacterium]|jgi:thymidylate kinase|nr:hypothetical protein [Thermoanaerobaculia bacterium]
MSRTHCGTGTLVCFEGGDAAGKSAVAGAIAKLLQDRGLDLVLIDKKSAEGFEHPALSDRMKDLKRVLWDYPADAPLWEWGDQHWFHLIVSWFSLLDHCKIQPLLKQGKFVVLDNWFYKFAARFLLKPEFEHHFVLSSFRHLTVPKLVVFLDVDPRRTVVRREAFSATEAGRMDGYKMGDSADFISYQERVLERLRCFRDTGWVRIDASDKTLEELVEEAARIVFSAANRHGETAHSGSDLGIQTWSEVPGYRRATRRRRSRENFAQCRLFEGQ